MRKTTPIEIRFLKRMSLLDKSDKCVEWTGKLNFAGYGMIRKEGVIDTDSRAHRISYEIFRGPMPDGYVVDHVCRNRKCVNPRHLRAVTSRENALENSKSPSAHNYMKTHCQKGHKFTHKNTIVKRGSDGKIKRRCRKCYVNYYTNKIYSKI